MDFQEAAERLSAAKITNQDLADACGVSRNAIERARLDPSSAAYRKPPPNWREAVIRLAEDREGRLRELVEMIRSEGSQ